MSHFFPLKNGWKFGNSLQDPYSDHIPSIDTMVIKLRSFWGEWVVTQIYIIAMTFIQGQNNKNEKYN